LNCLQYYYYGIIMFFKKKNNISNIHIVGRNNNNNIVTRNGTINQVYRIVFEHCLIRDEQHGNLLRSNKKKKERDMVLTVVKALILFT
jgi:hypothetical protein